MQSKMTLSFSIFLMLMLTQVAFSDKNDAKSPGGRVELNKTPDDVTQNLGDFFKQISENSKRLKQQLKDLVKQETSDVKAKLNLALELINSPENEKKMQDLLNDLPKMKSEDISKKVKEAMRKLVDQDIPAAKAQINNIVNQVGSSEMRRKLLDLSEKLSKIFLEEIPEKIKEILKNVGNQGSPADGKNY